MSVRQLVPQNLANIPPGPELAGVLAGLELSRASGFDCVEVLKSQYRQANHERARVLAAMAEVGVCGLVPDDDLTRPPRCVPLPTSGCVISEYPVQRTARGGSHGGT